jgi:pantoate--beta-alanine ligase
MAYKNKKSTFLSVNGCTARTAHFGYKDISLCVWTGNVQAFLFAKMTKKKPQERSIMKITGSIEEVRAQVKEWKGQGLSVGLVPTMGYLHEGHKSLIDRAVTENDRVVVSDFVNPIQFGANEDLSTYPRDIEADKKLCEAAGADLIFHPEPNEMYTSGFSTYVEMQKVSEGLCGKSRPTHFRGVCTVVCKLFHIVNPDQAYFGQKDAQQLAVIRRMVRDLDMDIRIVGCPIVREADGLAKSSRNTYLNEEGRKAALVLSRAVFHGEAMVRNGERRPDVIVREMAQIIEAEPLAKIDYVELVDADSIQPLAKVKGRVLAAVAVYIGTTRLIDNFIIEV